jgi:uncharacterized protein (TIGR02996 family)
MTEADAFIQANIESPEDDDERLIYADWLADHDQADRGDLIRVQCELARLPPDDPRAEPLLKRQRKLLRPANRKVWEAGRPQFAGKGEFVRGFLMPSLKEPVTTFVGRQPEDFGPFPLWRVTLTGLANDPRRIEHLTELTTSRNLLRAGELHLIANSIGASGMKVFAVCPHLTHVRKLSLRRNWMRVEGMKHLVEGASWPRVTHLDLAGNWLDDAGVELLAGSPLLANIVELDLTQNNVRDPGAAALARSPHLGHLRSLVLVGYIGDPGAQALADAPWAAGLKHLVLTNQLRDDGARALAESPSLAGLECLDVGYNPHMGLRGCDALSERFGKRVRLPRRR